MTTENLIAEESFSVGVFFSSFFFQRQILENTCLTSDWHCHWKLVGVVCATVMVAWGQPSSYLSWLSHMLCRLDWGGRTLFDIFLYIYMQPRLRIYTCQKLFAWEKSKNQYDRLQSNLYMSHHDRGVFKGQALVMSPFIWYGNCLLYSTPCL